MAPYVRTPVLCVAKCAGHLGGKSSSEVLENNWDEYLEMADIEGYMTIGRNRSESRIFQGRCVKTGGALEMYRAANGKCGLCHLH